MKVLIAGAMIALLTASAYAQDGSGGAGGGKRHGRHGQKTEQQSKPKVDDGAYRAALKSIPDQPPGDPWQGVRPGPH